MKNHLGFLLAISISVPIFSSISLGPAVIGQVDIFLLLLGPYVLVSKQLTFPKRDLKTIFPLIGILIYSIILIPFQQFSIANSLVESIELIEIIVAFILIYQLLSDDVADQIMFVLFVTAVIGSAISIPYYFITNNRFVGVWFISGIPSFALFYGLSSYLNTRDWLSGIGLVLILFRIILARSRSVWLLVPIAGFLGIIVANGNSIPKEKIRAFGSISAVGVVTVFPLVALLPDLRSRFVSIISGSQGLFARPVRYFSGIQAVRNHPFGVGLANYSVALQEMVSRNMLIFPEWFRSITGDWIINRQLEKFRVGKGGPHSDFFKLLVETGLIGVSLFILFWLMILRSLMSREAYQHRTAVQATIIYFGLQSIVNSVLLAGNGIPLVVFLCIDIYKSK